ncbi:MAG: glutathione synthase [Candidatus Accumulibacter sp.]|jgi:glutathione synthase|nr:glutathione synthase [Accumulibacter sp.]
MRLAFIVDPLDTLKAYKDSSVAMMRAAQAAGHSVFAVPQPSLTWTTEHGVRAEATQVTLLEGDHPWCEEGARALLPLRDFTAVIMRKDPPFDMEYVASTWLLERAEAEGARVFNSPRALRDHSEKFSVAEFARFAAPTLVARDATRIGEFIGAYHDVVLKPLDGMGGREIFRVREDDPNRNVIVETLTRGGRRTIMAQRFIPEIVDGDKRILIVGGEVVPHCLARIPMAGETRGNLAAGGRGEARPLTPRDFEIAKALAPTFAERGLLFVGIDVIGDWLTEINVTSPTCMVEIRQQTGYDAAALFIRKIEETCAANTAKGEKL